MDSIKSQAELYRIGLLLSLFDISEVIAWCDSVIMVEPTPPIAIIEASISGSQGAEVVAKHLGEVEGEVESAPIVSRLLRMLLDVFESDATQAPYVARAVFFLSQKGYLPSEAYWDFPSLIEEAELGIFDMANVQQSMLAQIEEYAAPEIKAAS